MSKFKGTKGKSEFVHTEQHPKEENEWHSVVQMPKTAISITSTKFLSKKESESNGKLIADAFNTINECDLLPSELLSQRNEFMEALNEMVLFAEFHGYTSSTEINKARELINKATKP
jgi:hypothetical protein